MIKTRNILIGLVSFFLITSFNSIQDDYRKYSIESGFLTYELTHFLSKEKIEQNVYFTNYGAFEYFEFTDKTNPRYLPVLKQDSVQYLFLSDSVAIKSDRTFDNIFEKCVFEKNSQLASSDFEFQHVSDITYMDRACQVFEFEFNSTAQKGTAIVWKNIPLSIESTVEGQIEHIIVTNIDTNSNKPMEKTKLQDYVDYE